MHRMLISAAHKSSGKTLFSVGLCAALRQRGLRVQPFKKGPDYIDPIWLSRASGLACRNLDLYLMEIAEIKRLYDRMSMGSDVCLVEGNKGLYDGLSLNGSNSNAELARQLDLPVILVLDARGMPRGIAPLVLGYQAFDRHIKIAGIVLNQLGGSRHESKLREVIQHYTDVPVLGALHQVTGLFVEERHLGLVPGNECDETERIIRTLGETIESCVDIPALLDLTRLKGAIPVKGNEIDEPPTVPDEMVSIGIVRDRAFCFYYADDLEAIERAGARLVVMDTLRDNRLPEIDGLYIGGGFPEQFASQLSDNHVFRGKLLQALQAGLPAYAECGGLMYLSRSITWKDRTYPMVGMIPGDVIMHEKPVGRGYVHLEELGHHPWPRPDRPSGNIRAHEFHYSVLENLPRDIRFAYAVKRGYGVDGYNDGIMVNNLLASYTHLRQIGNCSWASRFVAFVRQCKALSSHIPLASGTSHEYT